MAFFLHEWERLSGNFCFACWILHRIDLFGPSAGKASHILGFRLPIVSNLWVNIVLGKRVFWSCAGQELGQTDNEGSLCMDACSLTSVMSDSVRPYGLQPARLLLHGSLQAMPGGDCHVLLPGSSQPRDCTQVFMSTCIGRWVFLLGPPGKPKGSLDPQANVNL